LPTPDSPPRLTPRQLEVLELVAKGLPNRAIAEALGISAATAKNHVAAVIEALDVSNRTEAANALHELGLGQTSAAPEHRVAGFGERPALAVLPFDAMSPGPEAEVLADGLVADLVTRLSRWRWFPVISLGSTLAYKGKPVEVMEASRALGARYVIEGSVRRVGKQARVTVQLIDGESGRHVWAERYDRSLDEMTTLLSEIVDTIVTTLEPALARVSGVQASTRPTASFGVWEHLQRGFLHLTRLSADSVRAGRADFERAIELDPDLSLGYTGLAFMGVSELLFQISEDRPAAAAQVKRLAERAIELDPDEAVAHFTHGLGLLYCGDPKGAAEANERALELNPSVTWAHGGLGVAYCAMSPPRPVEAEAALETAIRLAPNDPFLPYLYLALGNARSLQGRLDEALACNERCLGLAPALPIAYGGIAFLHAVLGRGEESGRVLRELDARHPGYSPIEQARAWVAPDALEMLIDVFAAVGWPEAVAMRGHA
jgi:TolB-like protein/Flp pilus assembly protein TadD